MTMLKLFVPVLVMLLIGPLQSVYAYNASWPNEEEVWGLPEYCRPLPFIGGRPGTYDLSSPIWQKWYPLLGEGYKHTHHYCSGINLTIRSYRALGDMKEVRGYLEHALKEFDYVLFHSPRDFILAPEILMQRGRAFMRLKEMKRASRDFQTAIELNPQYMPPYAELIDLLIQGGDKKAAKELYEKGIQIKPDSPAMKQFEKTFSSK